MNNENFQNHFFESLLGKIQKNELVRILSKILGKQKQDIYRRINGKYTMSANELANVAKGLQQELGFQISIDKLLFPNEPSIKFNFNVFETTIDSFEAYVGQFLSKIKLIRDVPEATMYYGPQDLPLTFYGFTPYLLSFKMFVYGITLWEFDHLNQKKFSFDLISPKVTELGMEIAETYINIPSYEIFAMTILDSTLNQINYFTLTNRFENISDALLICEDLLTIVHHLRSCAELGSKHILGKPNRRGAAFDLYFNYLANVDTVFVSSPNVNLVFTAFRTPNFLSTQDPKLSAYTKNWLDLIMTKSPNLKGNPIERIQYFKRLEDKIHQTIRNINE